MQPLNELLAALNALKGDWHAAGCLEMPNLAALAKHASARRIRRSVETGAGKSTLLLSHLSDHHTVFALDDGESLTRAKECRLLRQNTVTFVDGPSQRTFMNHEFTEPVQLAFIDGPHGFPFPNMEYWKIYPHIEPGGLLVIDDIHIPTIRQLFEFLREDDMWNLLETVGKTAFFERTTAATFDPTGDGWWLQKFNMRRFPVRYADGPVSLGSGDADVSATDYREHLLPLIAHWTRHQMRVAIFGTGPHTGHLFVVVPELEQVNVVAFLNSAARDAELHRGRPVQPLEWAAANADVVLCSSFAHELTQVKALDLVPVKVVLSHPVRRPLVAGSTAVYAA